MAKITVEVLDGSFGRAADAMRIRLDRANGGGWLTIASVQTSGEGRADDWGYPELSHGLYRIVLDSDGYLGGLGLLAAYPEVQVTVRVRQQDRCHVQVALSPYFYVVCIHASSATAGTG
jgi:5-hydroxyisourate hydrolase